MAEFKCEVAGCGAEFDSRRKLHMHQLGKHRQRQPREQPAESQPEPQEQPQEQPEQPQQSDPLEKLRMFGIAPNDVMAILSPLVERAVVQTLEKMQLGEAINKKVSEVETKLSAQIKQTLEPLQAITSQPSGGDTQPGNTQLRDTILATLAKKFIGGDSDSFDSLLTQQAKIGGLVEAFTKPYREAELATMKRMTMLLDLGKKAGISDEDFARRLAGMG